MNKIDSVTTLDAVILIDEMRELIERECDEAVVLYRETAGWLALTNAGLHLLDSIGED